MRTALVSSAVIFLAAVAVELAQRGTTLLLVNIPAQARLSFSATSVTFPDADPTSTPLVASVPVDITDTFRARVQRNAQVTLTVQSTDDLRSGVTVLPAALITWTTTGAGFARGH